MAGKRTNILRDYHLLIARELGGFEWQIRYNRHANPVQRSPTLYKTHSEAAALGEAALAMLKREIAAGTSEKEGPDGAVPSTTDTGSSTAF